MDVLVAIVRRADVTPGSEVSPVYKPQHRGQGACFTVDDGYEVVLGMLIEQMFTHYTADGFLFIWRSHFLYILCTFAVSCLYGEYVCMCMVITYSKGKDQPGKVASPTRGQLNRKT